LKAQVYWYGFQAELGIELGLQHPVLDIRLGTLPTFDISGDTIHAELQYDFEPFEDNLLIVGADYRFTTFRSRQFVNSVMESRVGLFFHDEHSFGERLKLAGGARLDINTRTQTAISPRLALVYSPAKDHYLRLAGGTAFRKPTLVETSTKFRIDAHPSFPEVEELFEERGINNPALDNEILTTVELGYVGAFFDKSLRVDANTYFAYNWQFIELDVNVRFTEMLQIDMDRTHMGYKNITSAFVVVGAGASVEAQLTDTVMLFLRLDSRREWYVREYGWDRWRDQILSTVGGVWRSECGLTLHLAAVYIGKYENDFLRDPDSILAPSRFRELPARSYLLASARYGMRLGSSRLYLGISYFNPFGARFHEKVGMINRVGSSYGGELVGTQVILSARLRY
jgi:hypothetical protein